MYYRQRHVPVCRIALQPGDGGTGGKLLGQPGRPGT
jgi:hypothetical protein